MRAAAAAWFVASCLLAAPLAAQDEPATASALARGERVRLWMLGSESPAGGRKKLTGTIESTSPGTIELRPREASAAPITLKLAQVERLEVARGTRKRWPEGAAIGFVPGALFGGAVGYVLSCDADPPDSCSLGPALVGGLVVGAGTAGLGALIGLAFKADRWVELPTRKPQVKLTLLPARSGFRASLSVQF